MNILTIINSIVLCFFIYKYVKDNPIFYISIEKTFWCNIVVGIQIMKWISPCNAKGILYIPLRNKAKAMSLDDKLFKNGEYKKRRNKNKNN